MKEGQDFVMKKEIKSPSGKFLKIAIFLAES